MSAQLTRRPQARLGWARSGSRFRELHRSLPVAWHLQRSFASLQPLFMPMSVAWPPRVTRTLRRRHARHAAPPCELVRARA
eukprot:4620232-Pleurochrysis_carterae.AAC.1